MIKNNWIYCYINIFKHKDDTIAYEKLIEAIKNDELLSLCEEEIEIDGNVQTINYLGFKSYGVDLDDITPYKDKIKYRVIPFIFKHDVVNKKFADSVSGEIYSYHTYDYSESERKFFEDKGQTGEYLNSALILTNEQKSSVLNTMSNNDVQTYRKALRKLDALIKQVYGNYYTDIRKEKRIRERKQN
ncbi:MAG: hypothetical protein IKX00_02300 [Bacilli bacterium]|nr:hypothetical protein [Bacilli bacterium]